MALFNLNRAQDTPIATLQLAEITPINWHKYPPPVQPMTPAHVPVITYYGGDYGDDQDEASANSTTNYTPRNQEAKATMMGGLTIAKDVGRARGRIEARQPYPIASSPAVPDPVLTTLTPNTAVANTGKLIALVIGTGFTPWTELRSGGRSVVFKGEYISATLMQMLIDTSLAPAGTYQIQAVDHNTESNLLPFTLT